MQTLNSNAAQKVQASTCLNRRTSEGSHPDEVPSAKPDPQIMNIHDFDFDLADHRNPTKHHSEDLP